jgi:hypothetical protein
MTAVIENPFNYASKADGMVRMGFNGTSYSVPKSFIMEFHELCKQFDGAMDNPEFLKRVDQEYRRYVENRLEKGAYHGIPIPLGCIRGGYLHFEADDSHPLSRIKANRDILLFLLPTEAGYEIAAQAYDGAMLLKVTDILPESKVLRGVPSEERVLGGFTDYECDLRGLVNALYHIRNVIPHKE